MTKMESVLRDLVEKYITGKDVLSFEEWIQIAKIYYDHLGWLTVPMILTLENGKVKKKPVARWRGIEKATTWEDVEKVWRSVGKGRKIDETLVTGLALVCGKKSGVTAIDIDDIERFESWSGLKVDDLIGGTYSQRSLGGGVHLTYKYTPELRTGVFQEKGYDVRSDRSLLVLYPSYFPRETEDGSVEVQRYVPISYHDVVEAPADVLKVLRREEKERKRAEETAGRRVLVSFERKNVEKIHEIAPLIGKLYREGKLGGWWDIDCAFVGGLVQLGLSDHDIHLILQSIYEDEYNERESQYAIDRAREREESVRGMGSFILKLREIAEEGDERAQEILSVLSPKPEPLGHGFAKIGSMLLKAIDGIDLRPVGPHLELEAVLQGEEDGETYYLLRYGDRTFPMKLGDDRTLQASIEGYTGVPVVERKTVKEDLLRLVHMSPPKKVYRKRTGWYGERFRYPMVAEENEVWDLPHIDRFRRGGTAENHRKLVWGVLNSESDLSILYLASLSAPLLHPLGLNPYLVHVSGPHGTGKTTACMSACSLWYYARDYLTLFGTRNALELTLSRYSDLPLLLDEEELTRDTEMIQTLAYMLFSGKEKGRANVKLEVKQREVRSVVFTTSEHSLEDTLGFNAGKTPVQKLGSLRRTFHVRIVDRDEFWKGLNFKEIEDATEETYGHFGIEWIEFVSDRERIQRAYGKAVRKKLVDGSEHIFLALWTTYHLLCEFFEVEEIEKLREVIERYAKKQEKILHEDWNLIKRFAEEFPAWVAAEKDHFYGGEDEVRSLVYGKIEDGTVYVITSYFRDFCSRKGFSEKVILEELERRGVLINTGTGKRVMKKIAGNTVSTYAIDLDKLIEDRGGAEGEPPPPSSEPEEADIDTIEKAVRKFEEQGVLQVGGLDKDTLKEIEVRLKENYDVEVLRFNGAVAFKRKGDEIPF